ncbi:ATP-binding protein, partial [Candidatus Woesearchaeota archaeon]|nr:ATP-binding protein [Candidatus Woesearchaeota archaeon]
TAEQAAAPEQPVREIPPQFEESKSEQPEQPAQSEGPQPKEEIAHIFDEVKKFSMNQGVRKTDEPAEDPDLVGQSESNVEEPQPEAPVLDPVVIEVEEEVSEKKEESNLVESENNINPTPTPLGETSKKLGDVEENKSQTGTGPSLGTVITTPDGPCVGGFTFVINSKVNRGQFVAVKTEEGLLIASVSDVFKTNKYFENAGMVQEYSKGAGIFSAFPVKEWEYTLASCKALGVYTDNGIERVSFPPAPGHKVIEVDSDILNKFLGLDQENGIELGLVQQHDLRARFNLTKMVQKHLAILAISGAGKSYTTAVLLEELLARNKEVGRVAVFMIDNHGEYINLEKEPLLEGQVKVYNAEELKINVAHMSAKSFAALLPQMSSVQVRELSRIISEIRQKFKSGESYGIDDISAAIDADEQIKQVTKDALHGWLQDLINMKIFAKADNPNPQGMLEQGKMVIFNFNNILQIQKKQLIVDYFSRRLFDLRRQNNCPPYLEIIEEAHNFCPEKTKSEFAISRKIIETLAREGRKFYANICLISQRPVQLSTTALSQCNTQIIMRITNPYDLDHIKRSAEAISSGTLDIISGLRVGEALVIGEAAKYPTFVKVRKRKTQELHGKPLEVYAKDFESSAGQPVASGEDFI